MNDQEIQVEIAEGVRVRVARSMVADVISKTEPVAGNQDTQMSPKRINLRLNQNQKIPGRPRNQKI